jgi:signal transduction histidine kinase/DNA-binding response OmpR family regulator
MATILIVDDRPTNREFLVTLLGYGGHRLLEAADGAEALALVRAERPDLVMADILMPTMDGYEFVRQLRADPAIASTAVIFSTAHYHEQEAQALAHACGVAHILPKPCEPDVVLRTVDAALGHLPRPATPPSEAFDREHLRVLTDKLSQKVDELTTLNLKMGTLLDISQRLVLERDPERLLEDYCREARALIGVKWAAVGVLDDTGHTLRHFSTCGLDPATAVGLHPAPPQGLIGVLLREHDLRRLDDPGGDPQAVGWPSDYPPVHTFLGTAIFSPTRVYGYLCFVDKLGAHSFSADDERIAMALAAQLAVAYENAQQYAEIQGYVTELRQEIIERQVLEEQLRHAQKLESIGRLAGGVAHNFNNLMMATIGYADLLLRDLAPESPLRTRVKAIKQAGERAAALTHQLLAFSRKQMLCPKVVDLNTVIAERLQMLRRLLGEDITLLPVLSPVPRQVHADPEQLKQVMVHLAINARDAMPQGGQLRIETANVYLDADDARRHVAVRPGPYVTLTMSDTGAGMDAETLAHIFEPFFTTKPHGQGEGLGLSTVYGIVEQSGGHIQVFSVPGQGTTFTIYLPAVTQPEEV